MRLHCNKCGESVSTEVPDDTVLRGWIECPECIEKQKDSSGLIVALDEYIAMLGAELNEVVGLAFAHGWRSTRHEQGKAMRGKIQQLRRI